MRIRAGYLGKAPWYRNKNTGKHLRQASGKLKYSLKSIAQGSPNKDAVYKWYDTPNGISLKFGTQAVNTKGASGAFGYPDHHENIRKRFPFLYDKATGDLMQKIMDSKINKLKM